MKDGQEGGPLKAFAFCIGLWLAIGVVYIGWRLLKWLVDV